ncbi:MAG TPA: hypothetical protein DCL65_02785 [Chryseobacterium sp.]|nr:hypothetical protein [Chryseobacterium sp.]
MIGSGLYLILVGVFGIFMGRYFYNNAHDIYEYEKLKAKNWWRKITLKLNTPRKLKFLGILLMLFGLVEIIIMSIVLLIKLIA